MHFGVKGMKWGVRKKEAGLDRKNVPDSPFTVGQKINNLPHQTITKTDILIDNDARQNVRNGAPLSKSALKSLAEGPPRVLATDKNGRVISGDDINYSTKTKGYDPLVGKPSGYDVKSAKKGRRRDTMRALGLVGLVGAATAAEFLRQSDEDETSFDHNELDTVDDIVEHYGVKGMKWGVRRTKAQLESASEDFKTSSAVRSKARTSGTSSLTNAEMRAAIERMNLEQQYSRLSQGYASPKQKAVKFVTSLLVETGREQAKSVIGTQSAYEIDKILESQGRPTSAKKKYRFGDKDKEEE